MKQISHTQSDFALHFLKWNGTFSESRINGDDLKKLQKAFCEWAQNTGYERTKSVSVGTIRRHLDNARQRGDERVGKAHHKDGTVTFFWTEKESFLSKIFK